jgi:formyl-CoA transferase/CoA:oxalate CoA-transferase
VADIGAGMWAAFAVMAAIHNRSHEGEGQGQYIDISMMDAQVAWLTYQAANFFATGEAPKRLGAAHPNLVPYQGFMCQDNKYLNLAVGSERIWDRFCEGMEMPELRENPDYTTNVERAQNRSKIVPLLQEIFIKQPVAYWVEKLQAVNVPCGPINDLADVFSDPQLLSREMFVEMSHPTLGKIKQTGLPLKFSRTPGGLDRPPPLLGEHNQEVLQDLGFSSAEIEELKSQEVI